LTSVFISTGLPSVALTFTLALSPQR